ncbi:NAD(P)/FAD-dependent oxidoreductase [Falsihalocynthiibacter sp. SS001]|uniref:NAD(P)/FAD-dependent oxidoreductase n=1 Tax=Falsihalocynthiibacter sp. SS001 TaxID=3349698 RepID=UPI0036D35B2B
MDLLTANDVAGKYPPSYYANAAEHLSAFPAAAGEISCDVCVIGGGFTGLSTALHLAQRGYDVRLVEAQRVGFGASGRNGGQVGQGQRLDQDELESKFGVERAKELWTIGTQAVELVRDLAASDMVHADFHPGIVHADHRARYVSHSRSYAEKLNAEYDYPHVRFLPQEEIREIVKSDAYFGGTLDTRSGHIDPLQLALGLARMAVAAGANVHELSRVQKVDQGAKVRVHTDQATIKADQLVLACNGYIGDLHNDVSRRVMPINNYIVATEPMTPEQQKQIIKGNIAVADSKFVVNYFRFSDDNRLLFGGTESYGYRFPKDIAAQVRKPLAEIFPQLANVKIDHAWGGTLGITMNRLPHYERYAGNILSMSGFSGSGVALGTLSGQIAAEAIAGQSERFDAMANIPTPRFPGGKMMQHPLLVLAMLWYSLRDKL